jgi:hypothetical protein
MRGTDSSLAMVDFGVGLTGMQLQQPLQVFPKDIEKAEIRQMRFVCRTEHSSVLSGRNVSEAKGPSSGR